jgi:hypothetical protein
VYCALTRLQRSSLNITSLSFEMNFLYSNATHAVITVCRYDSTVETNCNDDVDNDCDGLVDGEVIESGLMVVHCSSVRIMSFSSLV